jgi:hypothetical protein
MAMIWFWSESSPARSSATAFSSAVQWNWCSVRGTWSASSLSIWACIRSARAVALVVLRSEIRFVKSVVSRYSACVTMAFVTSVMAWVVFLVRSAMACALLDSLSSTGLSCSALCHWTTVTATPIAVSIPRNRAPYCGRALRLASADEASNFVARPVIDAARSLFADLNEAASSLFAFVTSARRSRNWMAVSSPSARMALPWFSTRSQRAS